jgi:hypothetical protein
MAESTGDLRRLRLVDLHKETERRLEDSHRMEEQAADERAVEFISESVSSQVFLEILPVQG